MATSALKPRIVQFGAGGLEVQSFDGSSYEALEIPAAQGNGNELERCLAWHGGWLLMRDDATAECFLLHLASQRRVHLPRLQNPPPPGESSFALAVASNSPETFTEDCTVVLSVHGDPWLFYCRPGDVDDMWWWRRLSVREAMGDCLGLLDGAVVADGGRVYVTTMGGIVAVLDATSLPVPRVESHEATLPPTPTHLRTTSHLLLEPTTGDILRVLLYLQPYGRRQRRVVDVDIHVIRPRSKDTWESVDSIGGRVILIGRRNSSLVSNAAQAKLQPNCIHVLGMPRDNGAGVPLYTVVLDDMSIRCKLLEGFSDEAYWAVPASIW
jgi:hypothetical protein